MHSDATALLQKAVTRRRPGRVTALATTQSRAERDESAGMEHAGYTTPQLNTHMRAYSRRDVAVCRSGRRLGFPAQERAAGLAPADRRTRLARLRRHRRHHPIMSPTKRSRGAAAGSLHGAAGAVGQPTGEQRPRARAMSGSVGAARVALSHRGRRGAGNEPPALPRPRRDPGSYCCMGVTGRTYLNPTELTLAASSRCCGPTAFGLGELP